MAQKWHTEVTLCNIYAPSGPQKLKEGKLFFKNLKDLFQVAILTALLMSTLTRGNTITKTDSSVNKLRNILNYFQLKDVWRQHNPDKKENTVIQM